MIRASGKIPALLMRAMLCLTSAGSNSTPVALALYFLAARMTIRPSPEPRLNMFDLGSGDGRIVILAARKYRANATGVEFDPALVKQSMARIKSAGIFPLARIIEGDLLEQDYSSADLITVYLLPFANKKLIPMFEKQLKAGARVVSHNTPFAPWTPVAVDTIYDGGEGQSHKLYLYKR